MTDNFNPDWLRNELGLTTIDLNSDGRAAFPAAEPELEFDDKDETDDSVSPLTKVLLGGGILGAGVLGINIFWGFNPLAQDTNTAESIPAQEPAAEQGQPRDAKAMAEIARLQFEQELQTSTKPDLNSPEFSESAAQSNAVASEQVTAPENASPSPRSLAPPPAAPPLQIATAPKQSAPVSIAPPTYPPVALPPPPPVQTYAPEPAVVTQALPPLPSPVPVAVEPPAPVTPKPVLEDPSILFASNEVIEPAVIEPAAWVEPSAPEQAQVVVHAGTRLPLVFTEPVTAIDGLNIPQQFQLSVPHTEGAVDALLIAVPTVQRNGIVTLTKAELWIEETPISIGEMPLLAPDGAPLLAASQSNTSSASTAAVRTEPTFGDQVIEEVRDAALDSIRSELQVSTGSDLADGLLNGVLSQVIDEAVSGGKPQRTLPTVARSVATAATPTAVLEQGTQAVVVLPQTLTFPRPPVVETEWTPEWKTAPLTAQAPPPLVSLPVEPTVELVSFSPPPAPAPVDAGTFSGQQPEAAALAIDAPPTVDLQPSHVDSFEAPITIDPEFSELDPDCPSLGD